VARMGEMRSAYTILARNPERIIALIALGKLDLLNWVSGKIMFKDLDLTKSQVNCLCSQLIVPLLYTI
jgi:hypothetical protein